MNYRKNLLPILLFPFSLFSEPVVVGEIMDCAQLGNQLFMIAATVGLALDHHAIPVFPDIAKKKDWLIPLNHQKVFPKVVTELPNGIVISKRYSEPTFNYVPIPYEPNMVLYGYFQSEKYFIRHKDVILDLFSPSEEIITYLRTSYGNILNHPNSVAVHLRSYMNEDPTGRVHITYGKKYIENAMKFFSNDAIFIIFSNNMPWCKAELKDIDRPMIFIEGEPHYIDFYFMSLCKHNIISNSSYSWWAAYLNNNTEKSVIVPKPWFNPESIPNTQDLKPESWIETSGF